MCEITQCHARPGYMLCLPPPPPPATHTPLCVRAALCTLCLWSPPSISLPGVGHAARWPQPPTLYPSCLSSPVLSAPQRWEGRGKGWETATAFIEPVCSQRAEICVCAGGSVPHTCVLHRAAYLRGSAFQNTGAQSKSSCVRILLLSCSAPKTLWP